MKPIRIFVLSVTFCSAAGCAAVDTTLTKDEVQRPLIPPKDKPALVGERPATYFSSRSSATAALARPVTLNINGVGIARAIALAAPQLQAMPSDPGVNLQATVNVAVRERPLSEFLSYLTDLTDYEYRLDGNVVRVSSLATRQWNLAALVADRETSSSVGLAAGSGGAGAGNSQDQQSNGSGSGSVSQAAGLALSRGSGTTVIHDEDEWEQIVAGARSILGTEPVELAGGAATAQRRAERAPARVAASFKYPPLPDGVREEGETAGGAAPGAEIARASQPVQRNPLSTQITPTLTSIRSLGLIRAVGSPRRVQLLDEWLTTLMRTSTRQVHLDMKALEVSLNDKRGRGIDWEAFGERINGNTIITGALLGDAPIDADTATGGLLGIGADIARGNDNVTAIVQFLGRYGEVRLLNQPNLTVTNGRTATLSSGDEIAFIASVTQTVSGEGGFATVTPTIGRILVGITIAVTPRVLDDERILIEVTPVVSTLKSFTDFDIGGNVFSNPNIALQELSTQVITRHGQTVNLGGLIFSRVQDALNGLPHDPGEGKFLNMLFEGKSAELDRREFVLTITPQLVES